MMMTGERRGSRGKSPLVSRGDHRGDHGGDTGGHVDPRNGRSPKSCGESLRRGENQKRNIVILELINTYVHVHVCTHTQRPLLHVYVHYKSGLCDMGLSISENSNSPLELQFQPQTGRILYGHPHSQVWVQHEHTRCYMSIPIFPFPFSHIEDSTLVCSRNHPDNLPSWKSIQCCDVPTVIISIPRLLPTNARQFTYS